MVIVMLILIVLLSREKPASHFMSFLQGLYEFVYILEYILGPECWYNRVQIIAVNHGAISGYKAFLGQ